MKYSIKKVHGLDGSGIAVTVVIEGGWGVSERVAFKTDGSATHWCWLEDGSSCPHEVWREWEAFKVRNLLAGKPAYECSFPEKLDEMRNQK